MAAEPIAGAEGAFEIDAAVDSQCSQVGAPQRFRTDLETERTGIAFDNGETGAVDGNALSLGQLMSNRRGDRQQASGPLGRQRLHGAEGFNEAREHEKMLSARSRR